MAQLSELQTLLVALLGSENVYFQPPSNVKMQYPCIIYRRDHIDILHADNLSYKHENRYEVTVVDANSRSEIPDRVAHIPRCSHQRAFVADNLNHNVFNLYF